MSEVTAPGRPPPSLIFGKPPRRCILIHETHQFVGLAPPRPPVYNAGRGTPAHPDAPRNDRVYPIAASIPGM
jgi:hypothetical protein